MGGMRITGLHPQRRHTGRANLHIDDTFHCGVAWDVARAHGLRTGGEVDPAVLERLRRSDECWKAKEAALSLLATRARGRRELSDRLRAKGYGPDAVDHAMAEAERLGLLDDVAFAASWVRDRLRGRPRGTHALVAELGRKGIDREVARSAVSRVLDERGTHDSELCIQAAEKWRRTRGGRTDSADIEERRRVERRLAAYLARRGFSTADIRAAMEREGSRSGST